MNVQQKKMFYALIVSSIVMFISIFTMSYKLLGLGLLQWIVVIYLSFNTTILKRFSFAEFSSYNGKVMTEAWSQKKYAKTATYALASPVMAIGLLFVITAIGLMIFVF